MINSFWILSPIVYVRLDNFGFLASIDLDWRSRSSIKVGRAHFGFPCVFWGGTRYHPSKFSRDNSGPAMEAFSPYFRGFPT